MGREAHRAMSRRHARLKLTRFRGFLVQPHMAARVYLRSLEAERRQLADCFPREIESIVTLLRVAWRGLDTPEQFPSVLVAMDQAQQRMHQLIRRVAS